MLGFLAGNDQEANQGFGPQSLGEHIAIGLMLEELDLSPLLHGTLMNSKDKTWRAVFKFLLAV